MTTPLLLLSDAPSAVTGLGRICRDLATRLYEHCSDIFDVGTLGYGGCGDRTLPFPQYHIESMENWFIPSLPEVWTNFAGERPGVIFTIWDASRLLWFARSQYCRDANMRQFLQTAKFKKWGYFPIDATGPNNKLSVMLAECMLGYDRIVTYSRWAEDIVRDTLGKEESAHRAVTALPHGIDTDVFYPRDREKARQVFQSIGYRGPEIRADERIVGIIATNQARKDWGLGIQVVAQLAKRMPLRLFIQTDTLYRHWSIPALIADYGLAPISIVNCVPVSDDTMSLIYSACDITLGIGAGEGFGYPIFESLACGCPVLTGAYGGHAEHLSHGMLIDPDNYRMEGQYNSVRPMYHITGWAGRLGSHEVRSYRSTTSLLPEQLAWTNLWPKWEQYFREAHQSLRSPVFPPETPSSRSGTGTAPADHGRLTVVSPGGH